MKLPFSIFRIIDWVEEAAEQVSGATGSMLCRTRMMGDVRVRLIEFSDGYIADHWCDRGHIVCVLQGELLIELRNGPSHRLTEGMSFLVSDNGDAGHRAASVTGARVLIVD